MADLESLSIRLEVDATLMRRELQRAGQATDRFADEGTRNMRRFDRAMGQAQRAAGQFALRAGAALAGIFTARQIQGAVEYGAELDHASQRIGFTAEALQELRFAASDFDIQARQVDLGLQRFSRRFGEAATQGRGELLPMLREMGIAFYDASGRVRSSEDVLYDYADAVAAMDSPQEQLLAAFKAFDSEGAALVNVLRQGSDGLRQYAEQAHELGLVLENDTVRAAAEADRRFDILGQRLRTSFVDAVLDAEGGLEGLADALGTVIRLGGMAVQGAQQWGADLGDALAPLFTPRVVEPVDLEARAREARALARELQAGDLSSGQARARLESLLGPRGTEMADSMNLRSPSFWDSASIGGRSIASWLGGTTEASAEAEASVQSVIDHLLQLARQADDTRQRYEALYGDGTGKGPVVEGRFTVSRAPELDSDGRGAGTGLGERVESAKTAAAERMAAARAELERVRGELQSAADSLAQSTLLPAEQLARNISQLQELQDSGALKSAALEVGLDVDEVRLRAIAAMVRELQDSAPKLGSDVAYLREQFAGMELPDGFLDSLAQLPDALAEAKQASRETGDEIAKSIAGSIGDSIAQLRSFRDLLQMVAQDLVRIMARRLVTNPLENILGNFPSGGSGGSFTPGAASSASMVTTAPPLVASSAPLLSAPPMLTAAPPVASGAMTAAQRAGDTFIFQNTIHADGADAEGLRRVEQRLDDMERDAPARLSGALRERNRRAGEAA